MIKKLETIKSACISSLFLLVLFSTGCISADSNTKSIVTAEIEFNTAEISSSIEDICKQLPDSSISDLKWAKFYYQHNDFKPLWLNNAQEQCKIDTLLVFLNKAIEHGIPTFQFETDTINFLRSKIETEPIKYANLALLELKLSAAFIRYCRAMNFGLVRPYKSIPNYYFKTSTSDSTFIWNLFTQKNESLTSLLNSIQPSSENYKKLMAERRKYVSLVDSVNFEPIKYLNKNKTIALGDTSRLIPAIASRLYSGGELKHNNRYNANYMVFDSVMLEAINKVRLKTGQFIDTEIGNNTIRALNYSIADYINKIDANLERLRWKPAKPLGSKYIRINVADMMLGAYKNDTLVITMKVCVGKAPANKTPFLQSEIDKIILNPSWSIPRSIAVKETSVMAAKDSNYLKRNRIKVFANGSQINPANADWIAMQNRQIKYLLVQDPGGHNALGRIKFSFQNPFAVYLHDTNAKKAFARHNRAVSHGCVRLEKPLELCFFALPEIDKNDSIKVMERMLYQDRIRYSIHEKVLTSEAKEIIQKNPSSFKIGSIPLSEKIPLLIDYFTFSINSKGEIIFKDDLYEMDNYVVSQLKNSTKLIF